MGVRYSTRCDAVWKGLGAASIPVVVLLGLLLSAVAAGQGRPTWERWTIRQNDEVWLKGASAPLVGTVEDHSDRSKVWFTAKGTTAKGVLLKADIDRIDYRETPDDVYKKKKAKVGPNDLDGLACIAWNCQEYDLLREAIQEWKAVLDLKPDYAPAYDHLVEIFTTLWERSPREFPVELADEEVAFWLQAEELKVESPGVFYRLGLVCRRLGLLERAGKAFEDAIFAAGEEEWSLSTDADLQMAEILHQLGKYATALESYEAILEGDLSPREAYIATVGKGFAALRAGEMDTATSAFQAASELQSALPDPKAHLGFVAYLRGDLVEAERLYGEARNLGAAASASLIVNHALTRIRLGRYQEAEEDLAEAEEAASGFGETFLVRAYLRLCRDDPESALEELAKAEELLPEDPYVPYLKGVTLRESGEGAEALDLFRSALAGGFDESICFRALGETYWALGDVPEAVKFLKYSRAGRTPTAEERKLLGRAFLAAGRQADARREFEAALTADPEHVDAMLGRGYIDYHRGEFEGSQGDFEAALRLDGSSEYARTALDTVRELADLEVWTDTFDREEGQKVRNRWDESERYGIEIEIRAGRCIFSGSQKGAGGSQGRTLLSRSLGAGDARRFARFEVDLDPPGDEGARGGVRLEVGTAGKLVVFVEGGKVQFAYRKRPSGWATGEIGDWPEGSHTLGIALVNRKKWRFQILLDGKKVGEMEIPLMKMDRRELEIRVYGEAEEGTSWEMSVQEVRIFRKGALRPKEEGPP